MRPHAQLFLHVAGAMALFGGTATVAIIAVAARRRAEQLQLARAAFATLLLVAIPAWVVMLVFGSWTKSKEGIPGSIDWVRIGSGIATAGIAVLLVATGAAYSWTRRPDGSWQSSVVGLLAAGYLVALGVAWWAMSAKTGL